MKLLERGMNYMEAWFIANWSKILLSLVTSGALALCGWMWKQVKNYKRLLDAQED